MDGKEARRLLCPLYKQRAFARCRVSGMKPEPEVGIQAGKVGIWRGTFLFLGWKFRSFSFIL